MTLSNQSSRYSLFLSQPFLVERPGLSEELVVLEQMTGIKLPLDFTILYNVYHFEDVQVEFEIGRIYEKYYYFGSKTSIGWIYKAFPNVNELQFFINSLAEIGLENEHRVFLLQEIDALPKKL